VAKSSDSGGEFKSFNSLGEFIKYYQANGLKVVLLDASGAFVKELQLGEGVGGGGFNVGILCGVESLNVMCIEFGSVEEFRRWYEGLAEELRDAVEDTWVVAAKRGGEIAKLVVLLRVDVEPRVFEEFIGLRPPNIKSNGAVQPMPPSSISGLNYEFLLGPPKYSIKVVDEDTWRRLASTLQSLKASEATLRQPEAPAEASELEQLAEELSRGHPEDVRRVAIEISRALKLDLDSVPPTLFLNGRPELLDGVTSIEQLEVKVRALLYESRLAERVGAGVRLVARILARALWSYMSKVRGSKPRTLEELEAMLGSTTGYIFKNLDILARECGRVETELDAYNCWSKLRIERKIVMLYELWAKEVEPTLKPILVYGDSNSEPELYLAYRGVLLKPNQYIEKFLAHALGGRSPQIREAFRAHLVARARRVQAEEVSPPRYLPFKSKVLDLETLDLLDYEDVNAYFWRRLSYDIDYRVLEGIKRGEIGEEYFKDKLFYKMLRRFYEDEEYERILDVLGAIIAPYSLRLVAFVVGEPRTGKDTLDALITATLEDMVAHLCIEQLDSNYPFKLESLVGKRAIMCSEEAKKVIRNVEDLKRLSGGSLIQIFRKYLPAIEMKNNVLKIVYFLNEIPEFETIDEGFLDRLMLVHASNPLSDEEMDITFHNRVLEEKADFMLFMIYAYKQLRDRGFKVRRQSKEEIYRELVATGSRKDVEDWAEENLVLEPKPGTSRKVLYDHYVLWCESRGRKPTGRNKFYQILRVILRERYRRLGVPVPRIEFKGKDGEWCFACRLKEERPTLQLFKAHEQAPSLNDMKS